MSTYSDAMQALSEAVYAAIRAADNEDGAPVEALRVIARDIDSLIDHGVVYAEIQRRYAEYRGLISAGFL